MPWYKILTVLTTLVMVINRGLVLYSNISKAKYYHQANKRYKKRKEYDFDDSDDSDHF